MPATELSEFVPPALDLIAQGNLVLTIIEK